MRLKGALHAWRGLKLLKDRKWSTFKRWSVAKYGIIYWNVCVIDLTRMKIYASTGDEISFSVDLIAFLYAGDGDRLVHAELHNYLKKEFGQKAYGEMMEHASHWSCLL